MELKRKTIQYTGPKEINSISEMHIEIAGLKHLIQEAKAQIKANEQLIIIFEETEKYNVKNSE